MQIRNPIIPGFHPDPSICRAGEDYYLVTSSFEYFPCIPIFHSTDLVNWEQLGYCVEDNAYLPLMHGNPNASGIYAPSIRYSSGKFYVICTNVSTSEISGPGYGNFIVTSQDPGQGWSAPVWVDTPGIDPSLFFDDDGKVYYCGSSDGIIFCQIDPDSGEILSEKKHIWYGTGGAYPEGPHIYKKDGFYYLMIAEGGTEYGHMETIARSVNVDGPYLPYMKNPIISNRSLGKSVAGTGHADLVEDTAGNWWGVCIGIRPICYPPKYNLGRETFLFPVVWNSEGWPEAGNKGVIEELFDTDLIQDEQVPYDGFYDDFKSAKLNMRWTYLYNPEKKYIITNEKTGLKLKGMSTTLSDDDTLTFLGVRQEHHDCRIRVLMCFHPEENYEEAGLAVYLNRAHHYEIAKARDDGSDYIIVRRRIGSLWKIEAKVPYKTEEVYFEIIASKESYSFLYSTDDQNYRELGSGEAKYLTTETGGAFTGNFFALYATGNGRASRDEAIIRWVKYEAARR